MCQCPRCCQRSRTADRHTRRAFGIACHSHSTAIIASSESTRSGKPQLVVAGSVPPLLRDQGLGQLTGTRDSPSARPSAVPCTRLALLGPPLPAPRRRSPLAPSQCAAGRIPGFEQRFKHTGAQACTPPSRSAPDSAARLEFRCPGPVERPRAVLPWPRQRHDARATGTTSRPSPPLGIIVISESVQAVARANPTPGPGPRAPARPAVCGG